MARKLASAVALIAMAVSATALALGLGDIQTRSALNQPFEAEVELLSVDPAELDAVRVKLASAEAFQRAGVDRPFFLSELKFTPQLNAAGDSVIRVTSDRPIREPFLNFLVEVAWPKGKLVREYTVLLDPPTTLARQPAPVARPQQAAPAAPRTAPAPSTTTAPRAVMPDEYRVRDGETLWGISRKLRPDGASLAQMMISLYKANPSAFMQGDINRLQRGRILRVPNRDEVFALSRGEAEAAYRAEQDTSLASRTQPAPSAVSEPAQPAATDAVASTGGSSEPAADSGELRIATPRPEGSGEAGAGDDAPSITTSEELRDALLLAREEAETSRQAAENLRGEVDELHEQLADMQRLMSLQNEQLARLQATMGDGQAAAEMAEAPAADTESRDEIATAMPEAGEAADAAAPPAEGEPGEGAEVAQDAMAPADTETAAEVEPTPAELETAAEPVAEAEPAAEVAAEPEPVPAASRQPAWVKLITDNLAAVAAAAVALVVLLIALVMKRRRADEPAPKQADKPAAVEDEGDESILLEPEEGMSPDLGPEDAAPAGNDTSFLSEFSPSEMHSLADETSEVDPVSEADVYIAYGRYDQAENLLDQALSREPNRMALKFKLLEVYYANRNVAAFTATAQELADAGQDGVDTAAWARVCDMGRDLAPDYPLFAAAAAAAGDESLPDFEPSQPASIEPLSEFNQESILDLPGGTDKPAGDAEPSSRQTEASSETDMDMTLDLDDLSMPHSTTQDDESLEGLESIDLELPDLDHDPSRKPAPAESSDDSLILDLDTGLEDSVAEGEPGHKPQDEALDAESLQAQLEELSDLTDLDDELSQLTADFEGLDQAKAPAGEPAAEEPATEADIPAPFADQMADEDEVQTKLDLAIAYVEMGDKEGARSILDEVKVEGSDTQKAQAEKLLADIES